MKKINKKTEKINKKTEKNKKKTEKINKKAALKENDICYKYLPVSIFDVILVGMEELGKATS